LLFNSYEEVGEIAIVS